MAAPLNMIRRTRLLKRFLVNYRELSSISNVAPSCFQKRDFEPPEIRSEPFRSHKQLGISNEYRTFRGYASSSSETIPCEITSCQFADKHTPRTCWNCSKPEVLDLHFCDCGAVLPPILNVTYFDILGVQMKFDLNTEQLTKKFRDLQRILHPDKFSQKTMAERGHSEQQSSMVNKAYQTLMKPLSRGMYLLELHGVTLEEGETQNDPELLMVIMEINEQLADAKDLETVQKIGQENQEILDSLIKEIAEAFKNQDIKKAKDLMITLKYYANIVDKVKEHEREAIG